jgi:predicted nucleic acid-binding protein
LKPVFVDTAGWMMIADASDPRHEAACSFKDGFLRRKGIFVTTDYVIDETLTLLRMRMGLDAARKWWWTVENSKMLKNEAIDFQRAALARDWFFGWEDQRFSFTDCTSFVVMRELGLKRALTSVAHFTVAGFQTVP